MSITDRTPNKNVLNTQSFIDRVPVFFPKEKRKTPPPPQSNRCNPTTMAEGWRFRPPPSPPIDEDSRLDTVRMVLYELNASIAPRAARIEAIQSVIDEFNHNDEIEHDEELDLQADKILFQKLAFLYSIDKGSEEVGLVATALELVYQASRPRVALSFSEIGNVILPLFIDMIKSPTTETSTNDTSATDEVDRAVTNTNDPSNTANNHGSRDPFASDPDRPLAPRFTPQHYKLNNNNMNNNTLKHFSEDDNNSLDLEVHTRKELQTNHFDDMHTSEITMDIHDAPCRDPSVTDDDDNNNKRGIDPDHNSIGGVKETLLKRSSGKNDPPAQINTTKPLSTKKKNSNEKSALVVRQNNNDDGKNENNSQNGISNQIVPYEPMKDKDYDVSNVTSPTETPSSDDLEIKQIEDVSVLKITDGGTIESVTKLDNDSILKITDGGTIGSATKLDNDSILKITDGTSSDDSVSQLDSSSHNFSNKRDPPEIIKPTVPKEKPIPEPKKTSQQLALRTPIPTPKPIKKEHQVSFSAEVVKPQNFRWYETNILAVHKIMKVLRYFSRVLSAMIPMAHSAGLLEALIYQVKHHVNNRNHDDITAALFSTIRIDALATIVNLACAEENKVMMTKNTELLEAIIFAANQDPSEEAREHAAVALLNLAHADQNKIFLASQDLLLQTLMKLLQDSSEYTRRYASAALFILACVPQNTTRMIEFSDGQILTALCKVLVEDSVEEARINAAEGLFNFARNNTEDTVAMMGNHPDVLPVLARTVITDYSADVRAYAARALEWLAADIHSPMQCHRTLLEALTIAAAWTKTSCISEAMKTQSMIEENRGEMVLHDGLLDALANLASLEGLNDSEVRHNAIDTIERLALEPSTRYEMAIHEGVMTTLTKAAFSRAAIKPTHKDEMEAKRRTKAVLKSLTDTL